MRYLEGKLTYYVLGGVNGDNALHITYRLSYAEQTMN